MDIPNVPSDNDQLKKLNQWLLLLVVFIIVWTIGMVVYVQKRTEPVKTIPPVVMVDVGTGRITNSTFSNLFPRRLVAPSGMSPNKPAYEQRESYQVFDFVIVNYFFVEGMVVERKGDNYTVMYKDYNAVLQQVTVPRDFLLAPAAQTVVNPASLISP